MKHTLSKYEIANALLNDEYKKWSHDAAYALAEYYLELENDSGIEMELDIVLIRCNWNEYESIQEMRESYDSVSERFERDSSFIKWIEDKTFLLKLKNGHYLMMNNF